MTRRSPLLAALTAAVLVLAACDPDTPKPPNYSSVSPSPSASTSASPTASATPSVPTTGPNVSPGETPPTEPASARDQTQEGAQAFTAYYFRMLDWSYAVNRADLMKPLFASSCDNCAKLTTNLDDTFDKGTVTGTRVVLEQVALVANDGRLGAQFAVDGVVNISAGTLASGGSSAPIPAESDVTITLWVVFQDGAFRVVSQAKV